MQQIGKSGIIEYIELQVDADYTSERTLVQAVSVNYVGTKDAKNKPIKNKEEIRLKNGRETTGTKLCYRNLARPNFYDYKASD